MIRRAGGPIRVDPLEYGGLRTDISSAAALMPRPDDRSDT